MIEMVVVYGLSETPERAGIHYVGVTSDPRQRLYQHLSEARCTTHRGYDSRKSQWLRGLTQSPHILSLERVSAEDGRDAEQRWIMFLHTKGNALFNKLWFAATCPWTREIRANMSFAAKKRYQDLGQRQALSLRAQERAKTDEGRAHLKRISALGVATMKNDESARQRQRAGLKHSWNEMPPEQRAARVANATAGLNAPGVQERKGAAISAAKFRRWARKGWTKGHVEVIISESRNLDSAAAILGCTRPTLRQLRKHYGIG